jgi:hypothetical protein
MSALEHPVACDALDVVEAGETLEFLAGWLVGAGPAVAADLAAYMGPAAWAYPIAELVADLRRLARAMGQGDPP